MTIRTIVFENGRATIGVGGGITIDSVPEAELEETKLKAKALLLALGAEDPWLVT
jgi:anthranilate/para-aminobenzoate synthase component I